MSINSSAWIWLLLAIFSNVGANIALKQATALRNLALAAPNSPPSNYQALLYLSVGVALSGFLLVFYTISLKSLPVSIAYPVVTGLAMIGISVFSAILFNESLSVMKLIGIGTIILGSILVLQS
jgi:multidrug transporter EmrE-like cation transporter